MEKLLIGFVLESESAHLDFGDDEIDENDANTNVDNNISNVENGERVFPAKDFPVKLEPVDYITQSGAVDEVANGTRKNACEAIAVKALAGMACCKKPSYNAKGKNGNGCKKGCSKRFGHAGECAPGGARVAHVREVKIEPVGRDF